MLSTLGIKTSKNISLKFVALIEIIVPTKRSVCSPEFLSPFGVRQGHVASPANDLWVEGQSMAGSLPLCLFSPSLTLTKTILGGIVPQ